MRAVAFHTIGTRDGAVTMVYLYCACRATKDTPIAERYKQEVLPSLLGSTPTMTDFAVM